MKEQWPADKVERRKISDLVPYAQNSRKHSDEQIDQLVKSISEWGWTVPILIDEDGGIIAGHGRVMAAHRMGIEDAPCMTAKGWSEAQKRAYVIADNKLAENATWDHGILGAELAEIASMDFDVGLIGFDDPEVENLVATEPVLKHKVENVLPIKMTHILVSVPTSVDTDFLTETLEQVRAKGGRVDYGGN